MRFLELLYLTSVLAASVSASVIPSSVEEVLKSQIKDSKKLSSDEGSASHPTCTISDEEECALSKFSNTGSTLVKPGGDTRCVLEGVAGDVGRHYIRAQFSFLQLTATFSSVQMYLLE